MSDLQLSELQGENAMLRAERDAALARYHSEIDAEISARLEAERERDEARRAVDDLQVRLVRLLADLGIARETRDRAQAASNRDLESRRRMSAELAKFDGCPSWDHLNAHQAETQSELNDARAEIAAAQSLSTDLLSEMDDLRVEIERLKKENADLLRTAVTGNR